MGPCRKSSFFDKLSRSEAFLTLGGFNLGGGFDGLPMVKWNSWITQGTDQVADSSDKTQLDQGSTIAAVKHINAYVKPLLGEKWLFFSSPSPCLVFVLLPLLQTG